MICSQEKGGILDVGGQVSCVFPKASPKSAEQTLKKEEKEALCI